MSFHGSEELIPERIVDHAGDNLPVVDDADGNGVLRIIPDIVDRSVDGINHPYEVLIPECVDLRFLFFRRTAVNGFLPEKEVVGILLPDHFTDHVFRHLVFV